VWTGEPTSTTDGGTNGIVLRTHLHHFAADGGLLWGGDSLGWASAFALDPSDGSLWIPTDSVGGSSVVSLQRLSPTGALLGTYPRPDLFATNEVLGMAVNPTDGSVYTTAAITGVSSNVARMNQDGTIQWTNTDFITASNLVLDQRDASLWVTDAGDPYTVPIGEGSALVHLAADGTEVWRSESYAPASMALDPLDGSVWFTDRLTDSSRQIVHSGRPPIFEDVPWRNWASGAITACARAGIVSGYPDGLYHPEIVVTRDQMAVFVARALAGGDAAVPTGPATPTFPDVPATGDGSWAYKYVEYCVSQGLVGGYPDGNYWPLIHLDRGQMAVFIARAMVGGEGNVPPPPGVASFADVPVGFWAFPHVEYLASQDIVHGYGDGLYHPEYLCTRDQMAAFIARAFHLSP